MSDAFNRRVIIDVGTAPPIPGIPVVDGLRVDQLACNFNVKRDTSEIGNTCELEILNLNPDHREQIINTANGEPGALVRITAGYGDDIGELFAGFCNHAEPSLSGTDRIVRLSIQDGAESEEEHPKDKKKTVPTKVDVKLSRGMPVNLALLQMADACGLGLAPLTFALPLTLRNGSPILPYPVRLKGPRIKAFAQFANGISFDWSIQSGIVEGQIQGVPFVLNGPLLSSTLFSSQLTPKGDVTCSIALDHRLTPGTGFVVAGAIVKGAFICDSIAHNGSTALGGPWVSTVTGIPL